VTIIPLPKGPRNLSRVVAFLSALPITRAYDVKIVEHRAERTDPQNNALWGVAYKALSEHTGYQPHELHEEMCKRFFGVVTREVLGNFVARPARTTTHDENGNRDVMPWDKFCDFYRAIQLLGDELGCWIPDPDPMKKTR